jgi:hypothetical protein
VALTENMTILCKGAAGFYRSSILWHDFLKDITHA